MTLRYFVTVGRKPYGGQFLQDEASAVSLAKSAKAELPQADVVAWAEEKGSEPFEVWENGNPESPEG